MNFNNKFNNNYASNNSQFFEANSADYCKPTAISNNIALTAIGDHFCGVQ